VQRQPLLCHRRCRAGRCGLSEPPVRWVVPYPPGASKDFTARIFAQKLAEHFGQHFDIDKAVPAPSAPYAAIVAEAEPNGLHAAACQSRTQREQYSHASQAALSHDDIAPCSTRLLPLITSAIRVSANRRQTLNDYAKSASRKINWLRPAMAAAAHGLALFQAATASRAVTCLQGTAPALTMCWRRCRSLPRHDRERRRPIKAVP